MDRIRLVASDLDGTLLRPDETVSERTRAALASAREAGITVVLVSGRPPRSIGPIAERARRAVGDDAVVTWAGLRLVELSAAGVTKAFALERLCRHLGIAAGQVVAVGDMPNDLAMLDWAGTGVAVANAAPEVLEAADEVTAANTDDGVALLLERILQANGLEPPSAAAGPLRPADSPVGSDRQGRSA